MSSAPAKVSAYEFTKAALKRVDRKSYGSLLESVFDQCRISGGGKRTYSFQLSQSKSVAAVAEVSAACLLGLSSIFQSSRKERRCIPQV
jgi:hypothetical protein